MKNLIFLLLLLPLIGYSQSECVISVTRSTGNFLVGMNDVKYGIASGTGAYLIKGNRLEKILVTEDVDSLVSLASGNMVKFTDAQSSREVAIARHFIDKVFESPDSFAVILTTDARVSFKTEEYYDDLITTLTACAAGSGSGTVTGGTNIGTGSNVYKTTVGGVMQFRKLAGAGTVSVAAVGDSVVITGSTAGDILADASFFTGTGAVGDTFTLNAGAITATEIADGAVTMAKINQASATSGQILKWNGSAWAPASDATSDGTEAKLYRFAADYVALSGDDANPGSAEPNNNRVKVWVLASDTTVTFSKRGSTSTVTITVPDSVTIFAVNITSSNDAANMAVSDLTVKMDFDSSVVFNQSYATMMLPSSFQVISTTGVLASGPSDAAPFVYDEGSSPQRRVTAVGGGDLTLKIIDLKSAYSNYTVAIHY